MTIERAGALALILGTVAMLGVMALHPSGVPHNADAGRVMLLGIVVHGVAIAVIDALVIAPIVGDDGGGDSAAVAVDGENARIGCGDSAAFGAFAV